MSVPLSGTHATRWSAGHGAVHGSETATVTRGEVSETAVKGALSPSQMAALCPSLGTWQLDWGGEALEVERVASRYALPVDLMAYGDLNGDCFSEMPPEELWPAIQWAEEAIDLHTGRSFTARKATVGPGSVLPADVRGVEAAGGGAVEVLFGASCDSMVTDATVRLAAFHLRPRATAENARGMNMDGVYVSYELATGADGSWTGLPLVDAVIESHRRHDWMVVF